MNIFKSVTALTITIFVAWIAIYFSVKSYNSQKEASQQQYLVSCYGADGEALIYEETTNVSIDEGGVTYLDIQTGWMVHTTQMPCIVQEIEE